LCPNVPAPAAGDGSDFSHPDNAPLTNLPHPMSQPELKPPTRVEDDKSMERMLDVLQDEKVIAVDTEADGFHSYREQVCLVQVTGAGEDFIVDPFADFDMGGLGDVLADPKRIKLFHDSEFDILILKRDYGFDFANLFDTRVAAAVLGSKAPGLASVLLDHFDVELDKSMQRSDWSRRPLTDQQVAYARLDTHYLVDLYYEQHAALAKEDLMMVLDTECRRLEKTIPPPHVFRPGDFAKVKGGKDLRPMARTILRELFILRDALAKEKNVPPFRILGNHVLLALAEERPRSVQSLGNVKGCSSLVRGRYGNDIIDVIEDALDMDPIEQWPRAPRKANAEDFTEEEQELNDRLKTVRKKACDRHDIEAAYLMHRSALANIARALPRNLDQLEEASGFEPWQTDWFGDDLLDCVEKFEADLKAGTALKKGSKRWNRS
jgi:ribonuclease D